MRLSSSVDVSSKPSERPVCIPIHRAMNFKNTALCGAAQLQNAVADNGARSLTPKGLEHAYRSTYCRVTSQLGFLPGLSMPICCRKLPYAQTLSQSKWKALKTQYILVALAFFVFAFGSQVMKHGAKPGRERGL